MTRSKEEKIKRKVLKALNKLSEEELSKNRGKIIPTNSPVSKKVRRHSGRKYPKQFYPQRLLEENQIEPELNWDDWKDYRDGLRNTYGGNKLIRGRFSNRGSGDEEIEQSNKKIKKQIKIRMAKKLKKNVEEWGNKVQVDEGLKALSDIKIIIDIYWERGYSLFWESSELIEKIEEIISKCKKKNDVILLIKKEIKEFYEKKGREEITANEDVLIKEIYILFQTIVKIPSNYLVISKLKYEDFLNG